MATEWNVLNLLRHSRHDWLNHLQLINGYLSMGRVDKVEKLVEDIVNKAKNESHMSHLNMDKVAEKLLTFNWEPHSFRISFEVMTCESDWSQVEGTVYPFLEMLLQLLDTYAVYGEDQHAMIMISDIESKAIEVDFQGALTLTGDFEHKVRTVEKKYEHYIEQIEWNESECYVKFFAEGIVKKRSHQTHEKGSSIR